MKTEEEKDHYLPERNHWCLVEYVGSTPMYYTGWFGGKEKLKPSVSIDFNKALKLHSKIAAEQIVNGLKSCSNVVYFKVEEHLWV